MGDALTRVPVSMRLPAHVVQEVENYAAGAGVRKTDAYLHFLTLGLEAARAGRDSSRSREMEACLNEILSVVRRLDASRSGEAIEQVRSAVLDVAPNYPAISKVYVFGSVARGEAGSQSDVDLRLVLDRGSRFNLRDLEHFCKAMERLTGREVDAVTSTLIKDKALADAIERDKVLIYERKEH